MPAHAGISPIVVGNWKMNGTRESLSQITAIAQAVDSERTASLDTLICVPATLLYSASVATSESSLKIGAQDCHAEPNGAYTGDISALMIADSLGTHVIVGHSERRSGYREGDDAVCRKASAAHAAGLGVIVCIGETEDEREADLTLDVLGRQLRRSIPAQANAGNTIVAYEPVWAIGTGRTPSIDDVAAAHAFLRSELVGRFGHDGAGMRLLYGGSVKPSNSRELMGIDNVNGALVGGASLSARDFLAICGSYW